MKPLFASSKDGTRIAYETVGHGQVVIVVLGALNSRKSGAKLAKLLSSQFTVVNYDRRGRGDSTDTAPYTPQREVEDVEGLIKAVGGPVCLYGHSSGAAVVLEAAVKLRKQVKKVAIYEAPYALDDGARKAARGYYRMLRKLLRSGRSGDAVALFIRSVGVSDKQIEAMRRMPMWRGLEKLAPTLTYDSQVLVTGILRPPISYHA
jgi:pimeloyl-ACP methyl ester carboxylesterase